MTIICDKCQHDNPDDSRFCNKCGTILAGNPSRENKFFEDDANEIKAKYIKQFEEEVDALATRAEVQALEYFQEKATKWIKLQFVAVTTAFAVLLGFLGFVGYKGYDLNEEFKQKLEAVRLYEENVGKSADKALQEIEKKKAEFKDFDFANLNAYRVELKDQISKINTQIAEINRIERSRYRILVHYDSGEKPLQGKEFNQLKEALYKKGYIIDANDIFNVSADRQEVIFYSNTDEMRNKVNEIMTALPEQYAPIEKNYEGAGNNDPFQIVIKLCPNGTGNKNFCK